MPLNPPALGDPAKVLKVTLGCRAEEIAENVIITPFVPLKSFLRHGEGWDVIDLNPRFFYKGFTLKKKRNAVTVILTGVGPSRVGDLISLLALTGAKNLLFAGAVGGLRADLRLGDFLVPCEAADGEGYSRYVSESFGEVVEKARVYASSGTLGEALQAFLTKREVLPKSGKVFTIGSIAFESRENLLTLKEAGFDALEMELSAFYAGVALHGFEGAAITYVSDRPLESSLWQEKTVEEQEALSRAWRLLPQLSMSFFLSGRES